MPAAASQLANITQVSPQLVFYCPRICDVELRRSIIFIGEGFTTSIVTDSLRYFFGISSLNFLLLVRIIYNTVTKIDFLPIYIQNIYRIYKLSC